MSDAFSGTKGSKWNDEVVEYLTSKFNSSEHRFMVLSKSVFINATLAIFDDVPFIINAATNCIELSFAEVDTDKMEPVIQEILEWEAFTKQPSGFIVEVDKETSRSLLFESGEYKTPIAYKSFFHNYKTEILPKK